MIDFSLIDLKKHAYIFNVDDSFSIDEIYTIIDECAKRELSDDAYYIINKLLLNRTFPDLKIIVPDGKMIRKEQIKSLISDFEHKSLYNWKKFYVIAYAENLNQSSANALLKFLEEPEDNIVAILLTKDVSCVINTIISRCEIINLSHYKSKKFDRILVGKIFDFILLDNLYKNKAISYENSLYQLKNEELKDFFEILFLMYSDIINYHYNKLVFIFDEYLDNIKMLDEKLDVCDIIEKSKKIVKIKQLIDYNVNPRVCLDMFFVGDINEI